MSAIQFTDRGTAVRVGPHSRRLAQAALAALNAPSILNTQPWRWRINDQVAELRADRGRQLHSIDPDGRLLTLSCGVALHHARIALASEGIVAEVTYLPDEHDPDLLATLRYLSAGEPLPEARRLRRAMATRRTDRRPFADEPVPEAAIARLPAVADSAGAHLHFPRSDDLIKVAVAAGHAETVELSDPRYRAELATWVDRPTERGDGVPSASTAGPFARPVPIRDFTATGPEHSSLNDSPELADRQARYGVLFTDGDLPADWLRAGEALSAVLLTATAEGLATSVMSDLVEVPPSRSLLRAMLGTLGYPAIVVRIGVPASREATVRSPRRDSTEMVRLVAEEVEEVENELVEP